jgi:short-subunit dehydrogenase
VAVESRAATPHRTGFASGSIVLLLRDFLSTPPTLAARDYDVGMELRGRRVLVTGATGGIGAAIARELYRQGAELVLTGRREEALHALAYETGAKVLAADLADLGSVRTLTAETGRVDALVLNAGLDAADDLTDLEDEWIEKVVAVNLTAPAVLAAAFARAMRERGEGHIVFISSMAGRMATAGNGPLYTATKWGVRGLALALREELRTSGVGVSTVFPGPIRDAGMFAETGVKLPASVKTNSPEDVARAVVRAIRTNAAELEVAAAPLRLAGALGPIAPTLVARIARQRGVDQIRREMASARRAVRQQQERHQAS